MKKIFRSLLILLLVWAIHALPSAPASAQTTKVTEMTEDTAPTSDDLVMTVNDPGGTPANRKVTLSNLEKGLTGKADALGTITYYVCAKGAGGTCVYNGDAGTVSTPSDGNACTTKALPCLTIAGVQGKIAHRSLTGVVTISLADTAGTGTDCYQPDAVLFSNPAEGGGNQIFAKILDSGIENYPTAYIHLLGNTTTPANVKITGATTCAGTTASVKTAIEFKHTNARIQAVSLNYFDHGAVVGTDHTVIYAETITATSSNPDRHLGYVVEANHFSRAQLSGTWIVTNFGTANINGYSYLYDRTPSGYLTLTYSSSGSDMSAFLAQEDSHILINGGTYSFAGTGAYQAFFLLRSRLSTNGDVATSITYNAANAKAYFVIQNSDLWESCGGAMVTCTVTAIGKRAEAIDSTIRYGGTIAGSTADTCLGWARIDNGAGVVCSPNTGKSTSAFEITSSAGAPQFNFVGPSSGQVQFNVKAAGTEAWKSPNFVGNRSGGTISSPSVVTSGMILFGLAGGGWDGSTYGWGSAISMLADGTFSGSSHPTYINMTTTPSGSTTNLERVRIASNGHIEVTGPAPTLGSGSADCGTSPVIAGNDVVGRLTVGTSTNGGKCTVTFSSAWTNAPICTVANETSANLLRPANVSTTAMEITGTLTAADKLTYHCLGYR